MKKYNIRTLSILLVSSLIFFSLNLNLFAQNRSSRVTIIGGKVIDSQNGSPLIGANVYLSNSLKGSETNINGEYTIFGIPYGDYELVASYVGYKPIRIKIKANDEYIYQEFKLFQIDNKLDEVTIVGDNREWKRNYKKFEDAFLGITKNSRNTKILNPLAINFDVDKNSDYFSASSDEIILVENLALGYRLNLFLENFVIQDDLLNIKYYPNFEELIPKNNRQRNNWERERKRAYMGSQRHFFTILSLGDFAFRKYKHFNIAEAEHFDKQEFEYSINNVDIDSLIIDSGNFREKVFHSITPLMIRFRKEFEERNYVKYMYDDIGSSALFNEFRTSKLSISYQDSYIVPNFTNILIDRNGNLKDSNSLVLYGYMAWERISDIVPVEYIPNEVQKFINEYSPDKPEITENDLKPITTVTKYYKDETIIENKTSDYYSKIQSSNFQNDFEYLKNEIETTLPLLTDKEKEEWEKLLEDKNPEIKNNLYGFWIKNDPTPTTVKNERLLEHWDRIAYAKKNFNKTNTSVYGTDPRGVLYVKYGKPDRRREGTLGSDTRELKILYNLYEPIIDSRANNRKVDYYELESMMNFPYVDIWIYYKINNTSEPLIYIFSNPSNSPFKLIYSVDELIPSKTFSNRWVTNGSKKPISIAGMILLVYYSELMLADKYFDRKYTEIAAIWERATSSVVGRPPHPLVIHGVKNRNIDEEKHNYDKIEAPKAISDFDNTIKKINMNHSSIRHLDSNNESKLSVIAMSFPGYLPTIKVADLIAKGEINDKLDLKHSLIIRNDKWEEIARIEDIPSDNNDNTSIFILDHEDTSLNYVLAANVTKIDGDTLPKPMIGRAVIEPGIPLNTDMTKLEISDLVSGIKTPDNYTSANRVYPFPVIPTNQIVKGDPLMVYLEIYHLFFNGDQMAQFEIEIKINYFTKRKFRGDKKNTLSQSFNFSSSDRTSKELLAFDISKLQSGDYDFTVEITDNLSKQKKTRIGKFKIIE